MLCNFICSLSQKRSIHSFQHSPRMRRVAAYMRPAPHLTHFGLTVSEILIFNEEAGKLAQIVAAHKTNLMS
jgi:hypothetical protein